MQAWTACRMIGEAASRSASADPAKMPVVRDTSIGVEFAGNYPDVTAGPTDAQVAAWKILVKVLRARYDIPLDHVYAHNWIDYKDSRYCEGCWLATLARIWGE